MFYKMLIAKYNCNNDITNINHDELIALGIKGLFIDVDGTLLPRFHNLIHKNVKEWIIEAKKHFDLHLISNNPSKSRIKSIAEQLDIGFTYKAGKPKLKSTAKCIDNSKLNINQIAIIGDRIFTDILVGNRLGIYTILVKPIGSDGKARLKNSMQYIENKIAQMLRRLKL